MKTIIAGSRDIHISVDILGEIVKISNINISQVVSGCARGIDRTGEQYALARDISIVQFPVLSSEWAKSKRAGLIRNERMGDYADALIAIWDGFSPGTRHMIDYADKLRLPTFVYLFPSGRNYKWNY